MNAINKNEVSMFKVGDKVVYVSSEVDFLDDSEIHEVNLITENGLYKVQGLYFSWKAIRHATPEEIAASHRIDNDMGDDSHIENHISKNCMVIDHE